MKKNPLRPENGRADETQSVTPAMPQGQANFSVPETQAPLSLDLQDGTVEYDGHLDVAVSEGRSYSEMAVQPEVAKQPQTMENRVLLEIANPEKADKQDEALQDSTKREAPPRVLEQLMTRQSEQETEESAYERQRRRILEARQQKRRQLLKRRGILLLLSLVLVALIYFLPIFHVRTVEVSGNTHHSTDEILQLVQIEKGSHLLANIGGSPLSYLIFRNRRLEEKLTSLPYVDEAVVRPAFFGKIQIKIKERVAIAFVETEEASFLIDKQGRLLERLEKQILPNVPVLSNVELDRQTPGEFLSEESMLKLKSMLYVLNAIVKSDQSTNGLKLLPEVERITVDEQENRRLLFRTNYAGEGIWVKLGTNETLMETMSWLRALLQSEELKQTGPGEVDATSMNKYFISQKVLDQRAQAELEKKPTTKLTPTPTIKPSKNP